MSIVRSNPCTFKRSTRSSRRLSGNVKSFDETHFDPLTTSWKIRSNTRSRSQSSWISRSFVNSGKRTTRSTISTRDGHRKFETFNTGSVSQNYGSNPSTVEHSARLSTSSASHSVSTIVSSLPFLSFLRFVSPEFKIPSTLLVYTWTPVHL